MAEWNMDSQEYSLFKFEDDLNADEQHPRIAHFQQKKVTQTSANIFYSKQKPRKP
jgi:hypothetical protein